MAEYSNTLAGLLALNDANLSPAEASDVLNQAPVIAALFAQAASQGGTTHKFQRDLTDPGVGFRGVNEGITNAAGTFEIVTLALAYLDATVRRDIAIASGYGKGKQAYMDREGSKSLKKAFFALECALFRSSVNKAFTGLPGNVFYDQITSDAMVVNAEGTGGKSVWLMRSAEEAVSVIAGNDGRIDMSPSDAEVAMTDASNRAYTALQRTMGGWFDIQVGSKYDAARIVNLDGTTGHTLTDDLISAAIALAPVGRPFNMIAMNRVALKELQQSRTATNPTGAPAPFPTEAFGIPIIVTDGIPSDEAAINTTTTTTTTSTQA